MVPLLTLRLSFLPRIHSIPIELVLALLAQAQLVSVWTTLTATSWKRTLSRRRPHLEERLTSLPRRRRLLLPRVTLSLTLRPWRRSRLGKGRSPSLKPPGYARPSDERSRPRWRRPGAPCELGRRPSPARCPWRRPWWWWRIPWRFQGGRRTSTRRTTPSSSEGWCPASAARPSSRRGRQGRPSPESALGRCSLATLPG